MDNKQNTLKNLLDDFDIKSEIKQEIKNLEGTKNNISTFLGLLFKESKSSFGNLEKYKIYDLFGTILLFINSNSNSLINERKDNLYINYLLDLLLYFHEKSGVGSLYFFNFRKLDKIDSYSEEEREFYFFVNTKTFVNSLILEINNFIDDLIEELEEELPDKKNNILEGKLIETKDIVKNTLLLENKIDNYINDFTLIFDALFRAKKENIAVVLNDYNFLEKQEELYYFLEKNKIKFLKQKDGGKIYNFILGISENAFNKTFMEHINNFKFSSIKLHSMNIRFGEICKSL